LHVYFLGIAGAGVSALASILVSQGARVSGSDEGVFPPVSTYLDRLGIRYATRFDAANVPDDVDVAVIGASAKLGGADNPEAAELKRRGVRCVTFPEFLGEHTRGRENIIIAGSFGKSSLTALIAYLLRAAGRDPGYFIGAVPLDLPTTGHWGRDPEMILEGDEYVVSPEDRRSKFVLYHPAHTLISSIVHDHFNMFPTMESYEAPLADLIALTPPSGLLVCARQYEPIRRLGAGRRIVWYGLGDGEGYCARDIEIGEFTRFTITTPAGASIRVETQMLGLHAVKNILGAAALLLERGLVTADNLVRALPAFRGVARRLDKKTSTSRIPVYEGFGSSYEKARSAIEAVRLHFPTRPLVVIFEPHTFSWRNEAARGWYETVFGGVDRVLMLPPPTHGAGSHAQMTQSEILACVEAAGIAVEGVASGAEALVKLERLTGAEVVLLLSSGPLDGLAETAPRLLDDRFGG
jgi:UDP-N-acetylmuramate: L-alanyl-gamma-D-glutamyl-meso-diaminopimelate ligase